MTEQRRKAKKQTNPNSLANLKPIEPGVSGNPFGRPKGAVNVSTALKNLLAEVAPDVVFNSQFIADFARGRKNVTIADALALKLAHEALINGESWAFKEILDRSEGKPKQAVDITDTRQSADVELAIGFFKLLRTLNYDFETAQAGTLHEYPFIDVELLTDGND